MERINKPNKMTVDCWAFLIFFGFVIIGYNGALSNYIKFALYMSWIFLAYCTSRKSFSKAFFSPVNLALMTFLLVFIMTSVSHGNALNTVKYLLMYTMQYGAIFAFVYYSHRNNVDIDRMIRIILFIWMLVCFKAISFYIANPSAARTLAADSNSFQHIAIGNGYSLAYGSTLLLVCVLLLSLQKRYIIKGRLFYILFIISLIACVFLTESTTTLLALIIGSSITLIISIAFGENETRDLNLRKVLGIIFIIAIVLLFIFNIHNIGEAICNQFGNSLDELYARRFYRIGEKLKYFGTGQRQNNYVDERFSTITLSFTTFLRNSLIGVGYKFGNIYSMGIPNGIGQHSEFTDILAQFGIIGGLPLLYCYWNAIKKIIRRHRAWGVAISLIILCIFNPFQSFQGCYSIFFIIPMLLDCTKKQL